MYRFYANIIKVSYISKVLNKETVELLPFINNYKRFCILYILTPICYGFQVI
jgi:hypothetical protein